MTLVRVKGKFQVTLTNALRSRAGVSVGDYLEAKVCRGGVITLPPKNLIDRSIAEGLADLKAGRTFGPCNNVAEMAGSIDANLKKRRRTQERKRA